MRIAVASSGLGHVSRGVEAWASDLAAALASRGEDVVLYAGGGRAVEPYREILPCWQRGAQRTIRVSRRIPSRGFWRLGLSGVYELEQTTFAWHLLRRLRRTRPDILHVQDPLVARRMEQARALGLVRTRTILAHGTEESDAFLRRFAFVQHLAPMYLDAAVRAGISRPGWTAIPNFVDIKKFHPGQAPALRQELGIPDNALVVLSVAAIKRHHKRIDWLLDRFAELGGGEGGAPLYYIVAGGREDETDALVAEGTRRLGDRIRFLVRYPRERIPELYRAADLFVLASLREMMPIAVLEALASGLPCLVHDDPVLRWMVGPGGPRLDLRQPAALVDAVHGFAEDAALRRRFGAEGRRHCEATFGTDTVLEAILAYYRHVVST